MRLAWLFLTRSGKSNRNRLGLTAAAVALGMLMILVFMAGINAIQAQPQHSSWRLALFASKNNQKPIEGIAPLKAIVGIGDGNLTKWQNENITTISLHASDATSPQFNELPTPKYGEYYVSKGLYKIIHDHPEDAIGERFGTKQIGIIPESFSVSPNALDVIRGMSEQEARNERAVSVYKLSNDVEAASRYNGLVGTVLLFGASMLLIPIVTFISIAAQLGSAQREKRYAALRLVGATREQVTRIIAVESLSAALAGVITGSLAYVAILPLLSQSTFGGMRFWQSDLTVLPQYYLLAVIVTLLFCLFANWRGMRHVQVSPLGVMRSGKVSKRPRVWRLILLVPGLVVFIWLLLPSGAHWVRDNTDSPTPMLLLIAGVMSIMFGILLAGPWLTSSISRLVARRTNSAVTLLASKRIAMQSGRIFRSVSGVVLALFAGSVYLTGISGIAELSANAVANNGYSQLKDGTVLISSDVLSSQFASQLKELPYVKDTNEIQGNVAGAVFILPCKTAHIYTTITCPADVTYVGVNFDKSPAEGSKWFDMSPDGIRQQLIKKEDANPASAAKSNPSFLVRLDDNSHLDQLRSFVASKSGVDSATWVFSGTYAQMPIVSPIVSELANLAYAGMGLTLFVAIASLIIATTGGLLERRRSFVTLRLGGMTVTQMKRTVMIESLIPLISVSLLACGLGIWVGWAFTSALSSSMKPTLTPLYLGIVIGSLVIAILAIRQILPMLGKITQPEENQTE
jgi:ABC-type lipoprotein release transport system permease subunit